MRVEGAGGAMNWSGHYYPLDAVCRWKLRASYLGEESEG